MKESIESSFKTDGSSLPDVSTELEMVKKYYDQLAATPDDETSLGRQAGVVDPKCRTQTQGMNSKAFISALFAGTGNQAYKAN